LKKKKDNNAKSRHIFWSVHSSAAGKRKKVIEKEKR
jgi:hypothetical protein